ncbi:MAG: response regulator [Bacteroidetes bacterium]|nr:MAG: response regulator [Bacteroidota bacterium]
MTKPAVILLVEDQRMDIELTLNAFRESRLANNIQVVTRGEEALDYIFGNGAFGDRKAHPLPDMILLDLKMPGIDGFEVLKQLKKTEKVKRIPVIVLTSSKEEGDRAMSYDLGANSYLVKPVSFESFLHVIKEIGDYWIVLNVKPPVG